jgi:inner membrane protein
LPSAFAHAFVGASLATALRRPVEPAGLPCVTAVLAMLAAAPDLDVIAFRLGIPYSHPLGHRGVSHSLFFAAAIALISLPLWKRAVADQARLCAWLSFAALASHGLLDAFTDAGLGVGLFIPLDDGRYFAPWRPIRTSPLSLVAFFSWRGLHVLANELIFVGLPTLCVLALATATTRRRERVRNPRPRSLP